MISYRAHLRTACGCSGVRRMSGPVQDWIYIDLLTCGPERLVKSDAAHNADVKHRRFVLMDRLGEHDYNYVEVVE